jgi:sugar lactone lactonase YvrE
VRLSRTAVPLALLVGLAIAGPAAAISGSDVIRTYAGNGSATTSGDGGPATQAGVNAPFGISVTPGGALIIPEHNGNRVRRVEPNGVITTIAGTGVAGFSGDGGPAVAAALNGPVDSAVDAQGNIYVADRGNHRVRRIAPGGTITTVAGNGISGFSGDGGPATAASLSNVVGVAVDRAGAIYIADEINRRVRRVAPNGVISTIAGDGVAGSEGDGGPAAAARLDRPLDVRIDDVGNLLIADFGANRIRRIDPSGIIATIAGNGLAGFSADGVPAISSRLNGPVEVTGDAFGNIYIADSENNRVRRVNAAGVITTVAGKGTAGFSGDGRAASGAELNTPGGVALNAGGDLFISDRRNNRVRKIDNPLPPGAIPEGTAQCRRVPPRAAPKPGGGGQVTLSAEQLLINQRISQAAVRRVNAIQTRLDGRLQTRDLCGGAFLASSFAPGIVTAPSAEPRPSAAEVADPLPLSLSRRRGSSGGAGRVRLEPRQLLISQRISQAAVRRANALTARLDRGLTGGDLRDGAVTAAKIAVAIRIASAVPGVEPAPSRTVVAPAPRKRAVNVSLTAEQILINQRIAQAAVRRSNALVDRIARGFSASDFRSRTIAFRAIAPSARP